MKHQLKMGAALIAVSALFLAGCGGGTESNGPDAGSQATQGTDLSKLVSYNPQPKENLKQGGELTLPLGQIGPDFNGNSNGGNSSDNATLNRPMNQAIDGCWTFTEEGKAELNKNFCTDFKSEVSDGQQTITITLNDKATWNDGTPIDYKTFQNTWQILNGSNPDYDIVSADYWNQIDSVERGSSDKEVIVKTKKPTYPLSAFFYTFFHPAINSPEIFNKGFVGNLKPEWMAGPFKLENYDSAAQTVTMVPNEKWWGDKPVLDKVTFLQRESQATIAAFRNGEIDAASANTQTSYSGLEGTPNSDIRRGQRLFNGGMMVNPKSENLKDPKIREAIFTAVNREELRNVRFNGLNYTEGNPGSMLLMPFAPNYQDNWPVPEDQQGPEGAKKVMESAGYTLNDKGVFEKDGKTAQVKVVNFGDDPISLAYVNTMVKQFKDAGLDASIDQKASSQFADVVGKLQFDVSTSGYSVGPDTESIAQYYSTNNQFETGDEELNKRIDAVSGIENDDERRTESMNIERDYQKKYFVFGTIMNGPSIMFVKNGLANYGPMLFRTPDWTEIGWQK